MSALTAPGLSETTDFDAPIANPPNCPSENRNPKFAIPPSAIRNPRSAIRLDRAVLALYLTSLALLPWMWFPPFPWLREHAQWGDAVFATTAALWIFERRQAGAWPRWRSMHTALAVYLVASALSLLFTPPYEAARAWKLLGVAELMTLAYITSDIAPRAGRAIPLTVALTSLATASAALLGWFLLFYAGDF